ncbi:MAG TPA: pilus assembly protein TadE [Peptococcaceae bacterium]|nr:MAG: TadE-like protein [Clostridia bacterium 41_269]HBT20210.1 pilus assembly protein TadE [Peptococcaceae bacterium]
MAALRFFARDCRGQALVELAMVIPILLMLLFGVIEFGRIFNAYLMVNQASREGARIAAVGGSDEEITMTVENFLAPLETQKVKILIEPQEERISGEGVSVTVEYQVDIIAPIISSIVPDPFNVSATTVMRVE